eukprot:8083566-Alexandrium_andersonii.AAC.1
MVSSTPTPSTSCGAGFGGGLPASEARWPPQQPSSAEAGLLVAQARPPGATAPQAAAQGELG